MVEEDMFDIKQKHEDKFNINMLIFNEDNIFYQIFNIIISIICLFSSYFYVYVAAFRTLKIQDSLLSWSYFFESLFFLHMVL